MNLTRRILAFFILTASLMASHKVCAASLVRNSWYSPIAKGARMCASSYKTWRMVHPHLATTSDLTMVVCGLLWVFNHFMSRPPQSPPVPPSNSEKRNEEESFYDDKTVYGSIITDPVFSVDISRFPDGGDEMLFDEAADDGDAIDKEHSSNNKQLPLIDPL
jgi:hypothetical protein